LSTGSGHAGARRCGSPGATTRSAPWRSCRDGAAQVPTRCRSSGSGRRIPPGRCTSRRCRSAGRGRRRSNSGRGSPSPGRAVSAWCRGPRRRDGRVSRRRPVCSGSGCRPSPSARGWRGPRSPRRRPCRCGCASAPEATQVPAQQPARHVPADVVVDHRFPFSVVGVTTRCERTHRTVSRCSAPGSSARARSWP
jgi:hypothetical protein